MAKSGMSPMMEHYVKMKEQYKDCILFYRVGDFYEMFFDDAVLVSKEIELTLTGKECGMEERAPMCGVPYHAADVYIGKLIDKGHKVAICEQVEDPKLAKGLVERKVIKIVTPGTIMSQETLEETKNSYLMCISYENGLYGIAVTDISTGIFLTTSLDTGSKIIDEINKYEPKEIIFQETFLASGTDIEYICEKLSISKSKAPNHYFDDISCSENLKRQFKVSSLDGLGLTDYPASIIASGALLQYMYDTQMTSLNQINKINLYFVNQFMIIDSSTRRNLELCETLRDKQKKGSLLHVLDKTKTAMGARKLREFIEQPLLDMDLINERLDAITAFNDDALNRDELRECLDSIYDLERLMTRISLKTANPKDLLSFRNSLKYLPYIKSTLSEFDDAKIKTLYDNLDTLTDIYELIDKAISEDAPLTIKEGGIFKSGYSEELDRLKSAKTESKTWLAEMEEEERKNTGIKTLKIRYNKVFGYYIEITNSFKDQVPDYFIRKQTLTNAERFSTDRLNELSGIILGAEDKLYGLEYEEYCKLRDYLGTHIKRVQTTAATIAELDAIISLAYVAMKNHYVRPSLNKNGVIDIKNGRHPVVERVLSSGTFIPNDTYLDNIGSRISIITGPNMAGKSTYMRQTALIVLMAQIGSFVPCDQANIGLCDRIFTRVGASDDLASGQSTFMVEMNEVANILRNATKDSLLILDEIGRGTSTFDGLSIAWAVVEYIADPEIIGAKTLFATHYHELTELEGKLSSVNNYCIAIKEEGDSIIFLRKIIKGGADRSYGIQVAQLAGVPDEVIERAKEIADYLLEQDTTGGIKKLEVKSKAKEKAKEKGDRRKNRDEFSGQLSMFATNEELSITAELKALDLNNMTPIKAMLYLQELKERLQ